MKQITTVEVIASLCADDKAGPNNQYVESGKLVIVYDDVRGTSIRGMERMQTSRNIKGDGGVLKHWRLEKAENGNVNIWCAA